MRYKLNHYVTNCGTKARCWRGIRSPKRVPLKTVEEVLHLYQEQYFDFNARHFHEKLSSERNIHLSYTWFTGHIMC